MWTPTARRMLCWFGLLVAGGCCSSVHDETTAIVCERTDRPIDSLMPVTEKRTSSAKVPEETHDTAPTRPASTPALPCFDPEVQQLSAPSEGSKQPATAAILTPASILLPPSPLTILPPTTPRELPAALPTPPTPRIDPLPPPPTSVPALLPEKIAPSLDSVPLRESEAPAEPPPPTRPEPRTREAHPPEVKHFPSLLPTQPMKPMQVKEAPRDRLKIPSDLPGAQVPPLELPSPDPSQRKEREEAIRRLFPDLPPLDADPTSIPGPNGSGLTLSDLQRLALSNNPIVRQAAADVEIARGAAIQAGLWPNPTVGFEGDQINTAQTAGYLGLFITQIIKTAGKPQFARASALIDVLNAQLAQRRAESELIARVRAGYFAVLVARENLKVSRALAEFADEVYRIQVELLKAAQSPAYEPLQLRVLSTQARAAFIQARNRYVGAWKQLATNLGLPAIPPTDLVGDADMPAPQYDHAVVLARVLRAHTDVGVAFNAVQKAQIDVKRARISPIPDVSVSVGVQRDYNQGAIKSAEAQLMKAEQEEARVRNDLTVRVAEAFERYDNNRRILAYYRTGILPDQVRAYRALYLRHHREPDQINLQDVVNAQQILAQSVTTYIVALNALWTAVTDVSNLLQTDELYADTGDALPCNVPVLKALTEPRTPSCCTPVDPALKTMDGSWPTAFAGQSSPVPLRKAE